MKQRIALLGILCCLTFSGMTQESDDTLQFEAGVSLNRYVPQRDNEMRPYFFAGTFRYNWKSNEKFDHLLNVRVSGNYNEQVSIDPLISKRYLALEAGYQARWRRDSTKWRFSWGVNTGIFHVSERITPQDSLPILQPEVPEPFTRNRYKVALSPQIAAEYYLNPQTYIQFAFSMSFGTQYYGDVDHLEFNDWRGFSAQAPSIGIFRKF